MTRQESKQRFSLRKFLPAAVVALAIGTEYALNIEPAPFKYHLNTWTEKGQDVICFSGVPPKEVYDLTKLTQSLCPGADIRIENPLSERYFFNIGSPHLIPHRLEELCPTQSRHTKKRFIKKQKSRLEGARP